MIPLFGSRSAWMLLVGAVVVCAEALECPDCSTAPCPSVTPEDCPAGIITEPACRCCCTCAKGLNETCGGDGEVYGRCGLGLECYVNASAYASESKLRQAKGKCRPDINGESDEVPIDDCVPHTLTPSPTPSPTPPLTPPPCPEPLDVDSSQCKDKCSIERCRGGSNKICSAQGLTVNTPKCRNSCQHTSCRACYFLVEPNCTMTCPEPPTKRCLGKYFRCVQNFYNYESNVLLELTDKRIQHVTGRIICNVPSLDSPTMFGDIEESGDDQSMSRS